MSGVGAVVALLIGTAAGTIAFAALADAQVGTEVEAITRRFGIPPAPPAAGQSKVFSLLDVVDPGASDRLKQAAVITAVGGAAIGCLAYAVAARVLT